MRWDQLSAEEEATRQLPGYREPATVRTFDAPEAMDIRFYEVRSKSVLNKVPRASRMPFRWTVNPYRGCTHACVYCADGGTPILMGDGRTRSLAEIQVGDSIYGTVMSGRYRRYVRTEVLAHWTTFKPAYRVLLADGTELVTSGDHRFLTERGWKHVVGVGQGARRRPFLTTGNELRGTGQFSAQPQETEAFRRGYLCGMIRGDGHLGSYVYHRRGRRSAQIHGFRLALVDPEALERTRRYLEFGGVPTTWRCFAPKTGKRREISAIGTQRRDLVDRVHGLIAWPSRSCDEWCLGFLSGIFDAEGSCDKQALRIANTDPILLACTHDCLDRFGFDVTRDLTRRSNGLEYVRIRGGLRERLRFLHMTDPAISRKRDIEGMALKSDSDLQVLAVEPLAEPQQMFDITTGTGDFIANGVVSHNCFARPTHKYLDLSPSRDFEREIVVKVNAPEALRAQLSRPSWNREHVALGTNTDPYQWVEGRYRLMPGIWEALRDSGSPCSVLTKSPLLLRDVDLLKELADRVGFTASLSVPTLDERAWRASEPHTPHPRARLEAVAELNRVGVPTGVLIAPLMPGVNDSPEQVERILEWAGEAGATSVGGLCLHLRGEVRGIFLDWLRGYRPDLLPRYEELYAGGAYAPKAERERIARLAQVPGRSNWRKAFRGRGASPPAETPSAPEQPSLF
ncbi:MAG TPA: LAGLIDADG family homing endonuclease [Thermoleophilaceae bacterium]|nr:LAGLIDADG family homing endonuclease [Thermoleophilaceae bacterium]